MCMMFCENGFKKDANGCEYCACKDLWTFKKIRMIKFSRK
jgi:hypothetical protein